MDGVRDVMQLRHYSIHTERSYRAWIRKFVHFHHMKSRDDLADVEKKIESFLTHPAVHGDVTASTQNQAMNALIFLYRKALKQNPGEEINAVRANKKLKIPVVMTREETARVLSMMTGTPRLIAKLLYGRGLRISKGLKRPKNSIIRRACFVPLWLSRVAVFASVLSLRPDTDRLARMPPFQQNGFWLTGIGEMFGYEIACR